MRRFICSDMVCFGGDSHVVSDMLCFGGDSHVGIWCVLVEIHM